MEIRTTTTFSDWTALAGTWDRAGVCRVFEALRIAGIRHVYWRVFNGGLAMYPSRVAEIQGRQCYEAYVRNNDYPFTNRPLQYLREIDFGRFDPLPAALEAAEEFGIRLHLWYTIYEDEHGLPYRSRFCAEHPQWWHTDREGRRYSGTFDWFFDEVRAYKLAIVEELLQYPVAGLMLDFVRHNATASADSSGVYRFGYNPEVRRAFQERGGADPLNLPPDDPDWMAFRREINTSLVREIRERMHRTGRPLDLALMLWPVDYARWACLDVRALCAENAVQLLSLFGLTYSMRPREARDHYAAGRAQAPDPRVLVLPGMEVYNGVRGPQIDRYAEAAEQAGAPGIVLHEADALVRYNCTSAVRAINLGRPNYKRGLKAARLSAPDPGSPEQWARQPLFKEFLLHFGQSAADVPSESTEVQLGYTDRELVVRFRCADRRMEAALAPPAPNHQNQYYVDALRHRAPYFDLNSFCLMLDPSRACEDYFLFSVTPRQEKSNAAYIDEDWSCDWSAEVTAGPDGWSGLLRIPFAALGCPPPGAGDTWGINLVRGIAGAGEKAIWFPIEGSKVCPHELGRLKFLD